MTTHQDIPADELKELQGLLRLKNYEQPVDGYFEDFLEEFHHRQRINARSESGFRAFFSKLNDWFHGLGAAKWAVGAGFAYAALMIGFFAIPDTKPNAGFASDSREVLPGDRRLEHVELEKAVEGKEILEVLPQEF